MVNTYLGMRTHFPLTLELVAFVKAFAYFNQSFRSETNSTKIRGERMLPCAPESRLTDFEILLPILTL